MECYQISVEGCTPALLATRFSKVLQSFISGDLDLGFDGGEGGVKWRPTKSLI